MTGGTQNAGPLLPRRWIADYERLLGVPDSDPVLVRVVLDERNRLSVLHGELRGWTHVQSYFINPVGLVCALRTFLELDHHISQQMERQYS